MKKAEEIFDEINDVRLSKQDVVEIIKQAQSEVIEETVKACAEAARTDAINNEIDSIIVDLTRRGFFLNPSKMKNQMLDVIRSHKVDSESILDVENQLKAKL